MKKIFLTLITGALLGSSCQKGFLDQVPDDRLTLEETFSRKNTVDKFLANVYSRIPDEFSQRYVNNNNAGPWTGGSDEAEFVWGFVTSNNMNIGAWDPTSGFVKSFWSSYYQGISSASYFIANINKCADCGANYIRQYGAEARALRAIYYFYLMRMFGPVVVLGETILPPDASFNDIQRPRNSYDECVAFVVSELDKAAADLPATSISDELGRINRPIALAFKQKVLLYAASPQFNGNPDYAALKNKDGKQLISQQPDPAKWKAAAAAGKAFIDEFVKTGQFKLYRKNDANDAYSPYLSCRDVMLDDWNPEVIYARVPGNVSWLQYERTPYHSGSNGEARGSGGLGATQAMVDAYFTDNGRSIDDPASGYVSSGFSTTATPFAPAGTYNQWVNREPRFYVGITFNGSIWQYTRYGNIKTITEYSGNSGKKVGGNDYTPTGYIVRKNVFVGNVNAGNRTLVLMRLAEVYLDYIEALNESDPGNPDILAYLNEIRTRAGIPAYGSQQLPAPAGQDAMRIAIRKERRVELAFENSRYFDVRRWKIAEQTEAGPAMGLNIAADGNAFYQVVPFETRVFLKKHYLFPIPQSEVDIDKEMVQNTGW